METKERNNSKGIIIAVLLVAIVVMSIGYAALSSKLQINGTAEITSSWNIYIDSITVLNTTGTANGGTPTVSSDKTSATFNAQLLSPGDSVTYEVAVKNDGSLEGLLSALNITGPTTSTSGIRYTVTGVTPNATTIAASGGTNTVTVVAEWVSTDTSVPASTNETLTVDLDYVQNR